LKLKLRPSIEFYQISDDLYHVYDVSASRHFKLGAQEVGWLQLLDGTVTVEELSQLIPKEYFETFLETVRRLGFLQGDEKKQDFSLFKIKLFMFDPTQLIASLGKFANGYRLFLMWGSLPILLINLLLLSAVVSQAQAIFDANQLSWGMVVFYLFTVLVSGAMHEGSHALVANAFNVKVPRIGLMLFYLHPAFYADVSGINLLQDRRKRVEVLLAGIMANNLLAFFGLLVASAPVSDTVLFYAVLFTGANLILVLINLIPFVEYDGYYVFQELLGEPQFSRKALVNLLTPQKKRVEYVVYGIISLLFQIGLVVSILTLVWRGVLLLWDSAWVDIVCLALIALSIPAVLIFRVKEVK